VAQWDASYENYKKEISMPILKTRIEELSWLISYAVRLEYYDNVSKYKPITAEKVNREQDFAPSVKSTNPFDTLDFHSKDFEDGVRNLAAKLNIPHHQDHLLLLRSVALALKNNLSTEALKLPAVEGKPFPIFDGSDVAGADKDLESAAQVLRLLQVQSVRELQTAINETIVSVQNITADPKTDSKLGKVGY
jgi:RLL motif containing protein 1